MTPRSITPPTTQGMPPRWKTTLRGCPAIHATPLREMERNETVGSPHFLPSTGGIATQMDSGAGTGVFDSHPRSSSSTRGGGGGASFLMPTPNSLAPSPSPQTRGAYVQRRLLPTSHHPSPLDGSRYGVPPHDWGYDRSGPTHPTHAMSPYGETTRPSPTPVKRYGTPAVSETRSGGVPAVSLPNVSLDDIALKPAPLIPPTRDDHPVESHLLHTPLHNVSRESRRTSHMMSPNQLDPFDDHVDLLPGDTLDDRWVTVFGFDASQASFILQQFHVYGEIVRHKMGDGNFMHIQYRNKLDAQKALSKNGRVFRGNLMVGVLNCIDKRVMAEGLDTPSPSPTPRGTRRGLPTPAPRRDYVSEIAPADVRQPQQASLWWRLWEAVSPW